MGKLALKIVEKKTKCVLVKKFIKHAFLPSKGSIHAAGFDLHSTTDVLIPKNGSAKVSTGIGMVFPKGSYGRLASRSGLALKHNIHVGAGTIDRDYRGEIFVILLNHSPVDYEVKKRDKVAQVIVEKIEEPVLKLVKELPYSERGSSGFGSTGMGVGVTSDTSEGAEEEAGSL